MWGRAPPTAHRLNPLQDQVLERRLLAFDPKRVPVYRFDVLVIGAGAGGGAAAVAAAQAGAEVAVLAKGELTESNTQWAQGGMAAVLDPADSFEEHAADTLRVGCGLSEPARVEAVVRGGQAAVEQLFDWGASFDRHPDGSLDLGREGGHGHRRILHAGDATGLEIQRVVSSALSEHGRIETFSHAFTVDLLVDDGRVCGALASLDGGRIVAFSASEVILATGGAGQVYRETTNPVIATGDGVALGLRAGAVVRDLEFFQFHPTCLYIAGAARVLISEIVRGAGGVLRDREGRRFMPDFHADAELAPRDVVSRAAFRRMVETGDTNVYLDLTGIDGDPHSLFPGISRMCRFFGIDIASDPVPVRPGAHYMIGGLKVDEHGHTSVPGLWAVGECASSGLHGANRMGSNSLLECLVLGTESGREAAELASQAGEAVVPPPSGGDRPPAPPGLRVNIDDLTYSLKSLMWRQMGVQRTGSELEDALEKISFWNRAVVDLAPPVPRAWELINMLTIARLAAAGALSREESRGVHFRSDFPEPSDDVPLHTELHPQLSAERIEGIELRQVPVAATLPAGSSS